MPLNVPRHHRWPRRPPGEPDVIGQARLGELGVHGVAELGGAGADIGGGDLVDQRDRTRPGQRRRFRPWSTAGTAGAGPGPGECGRRVPVHSLPTVAFKARASPRWPYRLSCNWALPEIL